MINAYGIHISFARGLWWASLSGSLAPPSSDDFPATGWPSVVDMEDLTEDSVNPELSVDAATLLSLLTLGVRVASGW